MLLEQLHLHVQRNISACYHKKTLLQMYMYVYIELNFNEMPPWLHVNILPSRTGLTTKMPDIPKWQFYGQQLTCHFLTSDLSLSVVMSIPWKLVRQFFPWTSSQISLNFLNATSSFWRSASDASNTRPLRPSEAISVWRVINTISPLLLANVTRHSIVGRSFNFTIYHRLYLWHFRS